MARRATAFAFGSNAVGRAWASRGRGSHSLESSGHASRAPSTLARGRQLHTYLFPGTHRFEGHGGSGALVAVSFSTPVQGGIWSDAVRVSQSQTHVGGAAADRPVFHDHGRHRGLRGLWQPNVAVPPPQGAAWSCAA